jgi:hypothetical protein
VLLLAGMSQAPHAPAVDAPIVVLVQGLPLIVVGGRRFMEPHIEDSAAALCDRATKWRRLICCKPREIDGILDRRSAFKIKITKRFPMRLPARIAPQLILDG